MKYPHVYKPINYEMEEIDKFEPVYSIGEASKKIGVIVPLLRALENSNVLLTTRNEHGKRLYSECDIDYISAVIRLGRSGNSTLEDIQKNISELKCWELLNCPESKREECPHYKNPHKPCWNEKPLHCGEEVENCRQCNVYRSLSEILK